MCTGYVPCKLNVRGGNGAAVSTLGDVQLACLASRGCTGISISSVAVSCRNNSMSLFQMQNSALTLSKMSFVGCSSLTNGGVINAYDRSEVAIAGSNFSHVRSGRFGGAVAAFGSNLFISNSQFYNSSSISGGGAVWASAFPDCFDSKQIVKTNLHVAASRFNLCRSGGDGGALLANAPKLLAADELLTVSLETTQFDRCSSSASGGAISASGSVAITLLNCTLEGNTAWGLGGGAVHLSWCAFAAYNAYVMNNHAPSGGGGALYWNGHVSAASISCPPGASSVETSCGSVLADATVCQFGTCAAGSPGTALRVQAWSHSASGTSGTRQLGESALLSHLCGINNTALYGQCMASDFRVLQASGAMGPVYSGVPFSFAVIKMDAYNTTIISDSSSLMQAMPLLVSRAADSSTSILNSAVSKMSSGVATFELAIKATFSGINFANKSAAVYPSIFLSIEGVDAESGQTMTSNLLQVAMQQGENACPKGYVLKLDQEGAVKSPAVCTFCEVGTYSLSPPSADSPICLKCPVSLDCFGGADARPQQAASTWLAVNGVYLLVGCPPGFQLINSTSATSRGVFSSDLQQCKACSPGQYIINPNTDECQRCPPGDLLHFKKFCLIWTSIFFSRL